jgi:mRNA interferase HigB
MRPERGAGDPFTANLDIVAKKATLFCPMRIISKKRPDEASQNYPRARPTIDHWSRIAKAAVWKNFAETRTTFTHADQVSIQSGRTVTVFNITNAHRLITVIHYNRASVFILKFITHADYSKDMWKDDL